MSLPLKDFRPELREPTHRALARIAKARGLTISALGRQVIEEYVAKALHEAKVILGQDDEYPAASESPGYRPEDAGAGRSRR